jgi:predicted nucleic-acid-binding Zn-ribbon protein
MIKPQDGTWYIIVTCENCKATVFLFPDLTEGKGSLSANYIVTCPRCHHKGVYNARHYFHPSQTDDNVTVQAVTRIDSP